MRLGPAEDPELAEDEVYCYYSRGLEVSAEDGFISGYRFVWRAEEGFRPFPGRCFHRGAPITLSPAISEAEIAALAGSPYWRDEDEEEILLFYEFDRVEWQVELTRDGRLSQWSIITPPSMADEDQRAAYGVTMAWPPSCAGRIRPRFAESVLNPGNSPESEKNGGS
jgi:hypothetical protein